MSNNKKIDIEKPIIINGIIISLFRVIKNYLLWLVVFAIFVVCYKGTFYVFTNDYIIKTFFQGKGYSRTCLNLINSPTLIEDLDAFYVSMQNKGNVVVPIFFENIPNNLKDEGSTVVKKRVFVNIVLPLLMKVETEILQERERILDISVRIVEVPLADSDFYFLETMASKYNIEMPDKNIWTYSLVLEELIKRVDIIPTSLALAMAAKETGWGTSRFLIQGNSLFSQHSWSLESGIKANNSSHMVRKYNSLEGAIRSYYYNINTYNTYHDFREARARMRGDLGKSPLSPLRLSQDLSSYSIEGKEYTKDLANMLKTNSFYKYDKMKSFLHIPDICVTVID